MSIKTIDQITNESIDLLKKLINIQSFSKEEDKTGDLLFSFFNERNFDVKRKMNNIWVELTNHEKGAPIILLNSHHDTVKPGEGWFTNPIEAVEKGDIIYGLGSNDAGASVVSLIATFVYFSQFEKIPYQLKIAITAEEEISGANGIRAILDDLGPIDLGIVGEPTQMHAAIAEKGLIVLDCIAKGKTGHAARDEGENAIYRALKDIEYFRNNPFTIESPILGKTKMTVTQINAGTQHNVVPDSCHFVVDIRTNECYNNIEVMEEIKKKIVSEISPRSYHLNSSSISINHPIVKKLVAMGRETYGSPTLSDQSVIPYTTIKLGPGNSARSHTPNEFIKKEEIKEGIQLYIECLTDLHLT